MDSLVYQFIGVMSTFVLVIGFFIWTHITVTQAKLGVKELRDRLKSDYQDLSDRLSKLEYETYRKEVKQAREDILKELEKMEKDDA